jgi:hypothetical protein
MEQFDIVNPSAVSNVQPTQATRDLIRSCLGSRWGLTIGGTAITVAGLALGWNWLTAVGLAPLILSLAPCLIMCALGMCMMSRGNSSSPTQSSVEQAKPPELTPTSTQSSEQGT